MIRVGIIDDEVLAREVIEEYCSKIATFQIVLSTGNPLDFINFVQQNQLDLIFLDIEMPELNGLEILASLIHPPKVILTTAYSEYALKSYEYGVVDYLLKPVKIERFLKAINKVTQSTIAPSHKQRVNMELQIKHEGIPINIPFTSIRYIQSFGNFLKVFTDARMYLITDTLIHMTNLLSQDFQRTHKSYIANLARATKVTRTHVFIENEQVPISASYKVSVSEKMEALAKARKS